jgi:hypothetical protein
MKKLKKLIMALYKKKLICKGFYPPRKSPWYSMDRRLGGPQNRSERCAEEKYHAPARNPSPAVQPVARRDATDTGVIRMKSTPHLFFT